jgi:hypothetical protein
MSEQQTVKRRRLAVTVLLSLACALAGAAGAKAAPPPEVFGNVRVNAPQQAFPADNPSRNSTTIAASDDGQSLLVGFEDLQGACGNPLGLACPPETPPGMSGWAFSTDGGKSWTDGGSLFALGSAITAGHPWVDRLARGLPAGGRDLDTWFFSSRLWDGTTAAPAGLGVYRGHFRAGTFDFTDGQVINSANPLGDLYSRQAIAAAKDGSAAAYVVLINVDEICEVPFAGFGQVEVWRTHDGGDTWEGPAVVGPETTFINDPNNPLCGDEGFLQIAPAVAIGPRGEVYTVWQYGPQFFPDGSNNSNDWIAFSRSTDGGKTWTAPAKIAALNAMRADPPVGYAENRLNDQPRIAVATSGPHRGRVYVTTFPAVSPVNVAATSQSLVSSQAYVIYSDDRGATWSQPVAVAPAVPATGVKRIWPTVSVRPSGDVDVVYLESQETETGTPCNVPIGTGLFRTGPASSLVDTFWVQSRDGGATFGRPVKVSGDTSNWCTAPDNFVSATLSNFGAYIGSASLAGSTLVVWPDDRNGPSDVFFGGVLGEAAVTHPHGGGNP